MMLAIGGFEGTNQRKPNAIIGNQMNGQQLIANQVEGQGYQLARNRFKLNKDFNVFSS